MLKNIIIVIALLLAVAGFGYYSLFINEAMFIRFLFFLTCAALMCLIIIKGVNYILPREEEDKAS